MTFQTDPIESVALEMGATHDEEHAAMNATPDADGQPPMLKR